MTVFMVGHLCFWNGGIRLMLNNTFRVLVTSRTLIQWNSVHMTGWFTIEIAIESGVLDIWVRIPAEMLNYAIVRI